MIDINLRTLTETDYDKIILVVNEWWGGRNVADMLPRLFFIHFQNTSFVLEEDNELVAFLCGFISQAHSKQAYIHFVGVHPKYRMNGLAKRLYNTFFNEARQNGCQEIHCITSPVNKDSIAFHKKMGFIIKHGNREEEGVPITANYNGPGKDSVLFVKTL